jgi:hypothetical protein
MTGSQHGVACGQLAALTARPVKIAFKESSAPMRFVFDHGIGEAILCLIFSLMSAPTSGIGMSF